MEKRYPRMTVRKIDGTWFSIATGNQARPPRVRTEPRPRAFNTHAEALAHAFRVRDYWFR